MGHPVRHRGGVIDLGAHGCQRARRGGLVITHGQAMDLWKRESPFRASGTSIHPRLEVTVDGVHFMSDFALCVQIADQTIAMGDWLAAARRT